jgi:hypothetical protein
MVTAASPFPRVSAPRLWLWAESLLDRLFDDGVPREENAFVEYWLEIIDAQASWAVMVDGELGGIVIATPAQGAMRVTAFFKPSAWGKAREALRMVYGELFDAGVERIQAPVFRHNRAMISLQRQLGGVGAADFPRAATINGRPAHLVLMVTTKEAYDAVSTAGNGRADRSKRTVERTVEPVQEADIKIEDGHHAHV